jgi:hypothetical protein
MLSVPDFVLLCVFTFWVPCCDVCYNFRIKTMTGSSLPPFVSMRAHVLRTLFVFLYAYWFPKHIVVCFCFVFLRLVYPMLPVSLDCSFFIAPFVFYNVYLLQKRVVHTKLDIYAFTAITGYLCWWTISSHGYHPPNNQYFSADIVY